MAFSFSEEFWLTSLSQSQQIRMENVTIRNDIPGAWGVAEIIDCGEVNINTPTLPMNFLTHFAFSMTFMPVIDDPIEQGKNKDMMQVGFLTELGENLLGLTYDYEIQKYVPYGFMIDISQDQLDNALVPTWVLTSDAKYPGRVLLSAPANTFLNLSINDADIYNQLITLNGKTLSHSFVKPTTTKFINVGAYVGNLSGHGYIDNFSFSGTI
jgi:hypothetical protein